MDKILYPIFLREKGSPEIWKFDSIYEMQSDLEKVDIENEEYEAWDSNGLSLTLKVRKPIWLDVSVKSNQSQISLDEALKEFALTLVPEVAGDLSDYEEFYEKYQDIFIKRYNMKPWYKRIFNF